MAKVLGKTPIPGFDCSPVHEYPPTGLCTGDLCSQWLLTTAVPKICSDKHAHESHYWWSGKQLMPPFSCEGRQYCDSKYMLST